MTCCICGSKSEIFAQTNQIEYKEPVFLSNLSQNRIANKNFQPSEFFLISNSIFEQYEDLLKTIFSSTNRSSTFKQNGLAVFHGSISFLQFLPKLSMQTISDMSDIPEFDIKSIFCSSLVFKDNVDISLPRIMELKKTQSNGVASIFDFCKVISKSSPTVIHIFLDSNDYRCLQNESRDYHSLADEFISYGSRISFCIFSEEKAHHSCFEIANLTGGHINFINWSNEASLYKLIRPTLDENLVYNCRMMVKTSGTVNEFAGHGLTNGKGIHVAGIVKHNEPFFVSFDVEKRKPFVQFAFYFSTVLYFHRVLVVTIDLSKVMHNASIIKEYIDLAYVQTIFLSVEETIKIVDSIKKEWKIDYDYPMKESNEIISVL